MSQKKSGPKTEPQMVMGVAWYRREQWSRLREVSLDADELEATYEEWLAWASERMRELKAHGITAHRVDVDVDELLKWCRKRLLPVAAPARAQYAAERIHLTMGKDGTPDGNMKHE